jgi:hypothetical protein
MRRKELQQRLSDGDFNFGDDLWFTCVSFSPKSRSFIRHVKPLKVRISTWGNLDLPGSAFFFLGFKKNGEPDPRQYYNFYHYIARPAWDHSAEVFLTEAEAQEAYQRQLVPVKQQVQEVWDARLQKLENLKAMLIIPGEEA